MTRTICDGLQVIEMGAGSIGASLAGMLLADNGARVLKVEPPEGDRLREPTPGRVPGLEPRQGERRRRPAHRRRSRAVRDLATRADVVIEGFGAGVADDWGLGDEQPPRDQSGPRLLLGEGLRLERARTPRSPRTRASSPPRPASTASGRSASGPVRSSSTRRWAASAPATWRSAASSPRSSHARPTGRGQRVEATMLQGFNPLDYFGTMTWQHTQRTTGSARTASSAMSARRWAPAATASSCPRRTAAG